MGNVVLDISMSLDGFVTGPNPGPDSGLGEGGERLHKWAIGAKTERDSALLEESVANTGAVLMGRRTFDVVDGPHGWGEDIGYGAVRDQSSPPPNIVVTSTRPDTVRLASMFTFVTDGVESALHQAQAAAGDKDVVVMGGANLGRQYLAAGLLNEVRIHLAPVILGAGTALFDPAGSTSVTLEQTDVVVTAAATHLTYRVPKGGPA